MSGHPVLPAEKITLPLLPLRDVVVFPHMVIPLFVGRPKSIKALEVAMEAGRQIMLVAQKAAGKDEPKPDDMFEVGCVSSILQMLKLPDGTVKVLVEGVQRATTHSVTDNGEYFVSEVTPVPPETEAKSEVEALRRAVTQQFDQYVKLNKKIPPEILTSIAGIDDAGRLADTIAAHLPLKLENKQSVLDLVDVDKRLEKLLEQLEHEVDILQVEKRIRGRVKRQMEKSQREYYLNEQVKAIQKELGDGEEGADMEELEKKIIAAKMPKEAKKKADAEFKKLKLMSPMSAEATVVRNYIDTLVNLPWAKKTKIKQDLAFAAQVLDEDHYGLDKVKDRILEYLAVQQRVDKMKSPILCLVGPPGVGKTSLGQSVARATGRKFVRMALGGVRDEAEIRGHRRTYVGALPGRLVRALRDAGTMNPVILLDEVDKLGADWRGDPSSALLEVLDPAQNHTFRDHYLDIQLDLSQVLFIATANLADSIPPALLDRLEVIRLDGYTEDEKVAIATGYLLPRQTRRNGLLPGEVEVTEPAVRRVIGDYTREAGVRTLERSIGTLLRKAATRLAAGEAIAPVRIDAEDVRTALGREKFFNEAAERTAVAGVATGLAVTSAGGDVLFIEVSSHSGKGALTLTGQLGDVMKESASIALSHVRSRAASFGIDPHAFDDRDFHVHVPAGAVPKDGPSAGVTMTVAVVSLLTGRPVRHDVGMTGEVTLRGRVLPVGGVKQKVLAAHRAGLTDVIVPARNVGDLDDVPEAVRAELRFHPVHTIEEAIAVALEPARTLLAPEPPVAVA